MKNILIFAGIAGIASAIAIYFTTEGTKEPKGLGYVSDAAKDEYDRKSNVSDLANSSARGFNAMS